MSSSRSALRIPLAPLEPFDLPVDVGAFPVQGNLDAPRPPASVGHHAYVGSTQPELAGDAAQQVARQFGSINGGIHIISEGNGVALEVSKVKDTYIRVKENVGALSRQERLAQISSKIRDLLKSREMKQAQLASICKVSRVQVSRWIHEFDLPSAAALLKISEMVAGDDRQWWRDQAAIQAGLMAGAGNRLADTSALLPLESPVRTIHFIANCNNSGADVKECFDLPRQWLVGDGQYRALRVDGGAISDVIDGEAIAVIDVSNRDAKSLMDCVVVARGVDGPVINWLREDQGLFMLQPLKSGPIRFVTYDNGEGSIIGRVVKWIADAPCPRLPNYAQVARKLRRRA
jgi:predicted XRE-type DNA-binding protein